MDVFIQSSLPTHSRSGIKRLIDEGRVCVNLKSAKAGYRIRTGDEIDVIVPENKPLDLSPWDYPLNILHKDSVLLVVNKPAGMVVHPSPGHWSETMVHALLAKSTNLSRTGGNQRPGIVHRLDKETSGVIVVARNDETHRLLSQQFSKGSVHKKYLALVRGFMPQKTGMIEKPIGRHPVERKKMSAHSKTGRPAVTIWEVLEEFSAGFSFLDITIKTGRTHQIRVHMASIGRPILGDKVYGGKGASPASIQGGYLKEQVKRHMLHAAEIEFKHPTTNKWVAFKAELPKDFSHILAVMREKNAKK